MAKYFYQYHEERGEFTASLTDKDGRDLWRVRYPDYYEDELTGELMEGSTIFDDGFMKNADDIAGLEKYLKQLGVLQREDVIVDDEDDLEENDNEYAEGGSIEANIKKKLTRAVESSANGMALPYEISVYVPSTEAASQIVNRKEFQRRIDEVQAYLSDLFGGFSSVDVDGGYESSEKGLIQEDVVRVTAFATKKAANEKLDDLINKLSVWAEKWGQESMGLEFEGDLFYVDKRTRLKRGGYMANGGNIDPISAAKSKAILSIEHDDMVEAAKEYAGEDTWDKMTNAEKDELISKMYDWQSEHIRRMAKGGRVPKFKVGDMVYSYQNKDYAAPISYTTEISYPNDKIKYKLKLKDGYSNWINEDSLSKSKLADGGMMAKGGEVGVDLFEDYENIPPKVQKILDKYEDDFMDGNYDGLSMALKELEQIGYTFDFYLDGVAYDLRKIGQKGKTELEILNDEMAKGGKLSSIWSKTKEQYGKAKEYTKKQIKDKKKQIALEVIDDTKDKYDSSKQKMILKGAEELVRNKYADGGMMAKGGRVPKFKVGDRFIQKDDEFKRVWEIEKFENGNFQFRRLDDGWVDVSPFEPLKNAFEEGRLVKVKDGLKDQYQGKSAEYLWDNWTQKQREHFVHDHKLVATDDYRVKSSFDELPDFMKKAISEHFKMGQYAKGGMMAKGGEVVYLKSDGISQTLVADKSNATPMWIMEAEYYISSNPKNNAIVVAEKINKSLPDRVGRNYLVKVIKKKIRS